MCVYHLVYHDTQIATINVSLTKCHVSYNTQIIYNLFEQSFDRQINTTANDFNRNLQKCYEQHFTKINSKINK